MSIDEKSDRFATALQGLKSLAVTSDHAAMATTQFLQSQSVANAQVSAPWYWKLSAVPAAAIAVALTIWLMPAKDRETKAPAVARVLGSVVQVGPSVAVLPHANADFSIDHVSPDYTRLHIQTGVVDVRLTHEDSSAHTVEVVAASTSFIATGTTYRVGFDDGRVFSTVFEGAIEIQREGQPVTTLGTMESWPDERVVTMDSYTSKLAAYGFRETKRKSYSETMALVDAGPPPRPEPRRKTTTDAAKPDDVLTLWRKARLFQGQGRAREALPLLREIKNRGDATWSPLALIEEIRLQVDPFASPKKVVSLANRFFATYPQHPLTAEVRHMWCSAHTSVSETQPMECKAP